MKQILDDDREIRVIYYDDPDDCGMKVGHAGVTAIKAYGEPGEYGYLPFLAIMRGEEIWQRMPASHVRIVYRIEGDE